MFLNTNNIISINTNNIISIKLIYSKINTNFIVKTEESKWKISRFFNPLGVYEEGFWKFSFLCTIDEFNKQKYLGLYLKDNVIYNKPYLIIRTTATYNAYQELYFDTDEEMNMYIKELKEKNPNII